MKKLNIQSVIDIVLAIWIAIWLYYLLFNWDVFIVKLNTNLGFNTVTLYPFIFFFFTGLILMIIIKYALHYEQLQVKSINKEHKDKVNLLQKDIEILKLKEVLFRMQTEGLNKNTSTINALQAKLDKLSNKYGSESEEEADKERKEETDKDKAKE